jgi:uncharacterized membrane protein
VVDPAGSIAEVDESNNERSMVINVREETSGPTVDLSPPSQAQTVSPQGTTVYSITVKNTGSQTDTVRLTTTGSKNGWSSGLDVTSVTLAAGQSTTFHLTVRAANAGSLTVTVTGTSQNTSTADSATCKTQVQK